MNFDPTTAKPIEVSAPSRGFDPSTAKLVSAPSSSSSGDLPSALGTAYAASSNFLQGANSAVNQFGSLLNRVLKAGADTLYGKGNDVTKGLNLAGDAANTASQAFQDYLAPQTQAERNAMDQNPHIGPLANTIGYMGGMLAPQAKVLTPVGNKIESLVSGVAPTVAKSPVVKGAISQGVLGGTLGAASNPEDPLKGGAIGAITGAALGGVGGGIGYKLQRGGDIVDFETQNLKAAGIDPSSVEGISRITKSLKDNGVDMSKIANQKIITNKIGDMILKSGPLTNLDTPAAETIANLAQTNFTKVAADVKNGFAPIRNATQTFTPENTQNLIKTMDKSVLKQLPKQNMPTQPTINDMWTYRERLDDVMQSLRAKAINGTALKGDLVPLQQVRNAISQDMLASAEKIGLKDQFLNTETIYKNQYLPFKTLNTESGKLNSEADIDQAMRTINTLLNPKISPKFDQLRDVATTLGSQGRQLVGQATLQNMYARSLTDKGLVNPKTYFTQLKKAKVSGMTSRLWDKETRNAAEGIAKILDGADEAMKLGTIQSPQQGMITKVLDAATKNRFGIWVLERIGSSKTPQKTVRAMIQSLITAGITINLPQQPNSQ